MATTAYEELTIAEAAEAVGISAHTIRYYERAGLLTPIDRNGSGHRRFTEEDIAWLVTCTRLRATGMPIRRIREYAELVGAGEGNEETRLAPSPPYPAGVDARATEAIASTARS